MKRMDGLDALRGIAALMVAISHSFYAVMFSGVDRIWATSILAIDAIDARVAKSIVSLFCGEAGVSVFFVLSGVVLGLSLDQARTAFARTYGEFLIKRVFRIYPAHLVVLVSVCTVLALGAINPGTFAGSTTWFNWYYRAAPSAGDVARSAALLQFNLNPVTWTLWVEAAIALVFPLLHRISRVRSTVLQAGVLAALVAIALVTDYDLVLRNAYKFYLGLLLPLYAGHLQAARWLLPIGAIALVLEPQLAHLEYRGYGLLQAAGAAAVVLAVMHQGAVGVLAWRPLRNLGERSYSFYLWHFPVLWFMYFAVYSTTRLHGLLLAHTLPVAMVLAMASIALAYALAGLSFRLIEQPSIAIGRRLAKKTPATFPPRAYEVPGEKPKKTPAGRLRSAHGGRAG